MTLPSLVALVLAGCACNANAPAADANAPPSGPAKIVAASHPADVVVKELADAFDQKDTAAVRERISDGFSGARFWETWSDEQWHAAAASLRDAKLKSASDAERVYTTHVGGAERDVGVRRSDGAWLLDYNEFQGPFPHE